jgi:hypothetical protein
MAADETVEGYYVGADGAWQEDRLSRYENEGESAVDIINNYLNKDTKYSLTVEWRFPIIRQGSGFGNRT